MTPLLVEPSYLSIGTLFSYLGVIAVAVAYAVVLLIQAVIGLKPKPEGVSSGVKSVRSFGRRQYDPNGMLPFFINSRWLGSQPRLKPVAVRRHFIAVA